MTDVLRFYAEVRGLDGLAWPEDIEEVLDTALIDQMDADVIDLLLAQHAAWDAVLIKYMRRIDEQRLRRELHDRDEDASSGSPASPKRRRVHSLEDLVRQLREAEAAAAAAAARDDEDEEEDTSSSSSSADSSSVTTSTSGEDDDDTSSSSSSASFSSSSSGRGRQSTLTTVELDHDHQLHVNSGHYIPLSRLHCASPDGDRSPPS